MSLSITNYSHKSWFDYFSKEKIDITTLFDDIGDWKPFFDKNKEMFTKINKLCNLVIEKTKDEVNIFPFPKLVFNAFRLTSLKNTKVVIIGQDPYPKSEKNIPQAMGLSFSVPIGITVPSSLNNIYKNLDKYGHINKIPKHGNLEKWASQGVLLLNSALTVQEGHANSHQKYWEKFTDQLIKHISDKKENVVFLLWGRNAYAKNILIDKSKHFIVASSHPSGLSCNSQMGSFPAFVNQDHFGKTNDYLSENGKEIIDWNLK